MKTAVIYRSHYGSTEKYAKWLAEDLGADLLKADAVKPADFSRYDTVVYGGGLYAGGVNGLALLTKNMESLRDKRLFLFAVGASDMNRPENAETIRGALRQKLPPELWERLHIHHLRGGLQYSKMGFLHRTMMGMMIKMLRKKPESELRDDERGMLGAWGQDVDFTDRASLAPLTADILSGANP